MTELLKSVNLSKHFGGLHAVEDVSITIRSGEILGIIGPNGAGKSTLLNCISGADHPTSGTVMYDGEDITEQPMSVRARHGIRRTFQLERLINQLTLVENVMTGMGHAKDYRTPAAILGLPSFRRTEAALRRRALELLHRLELGARADQTPATIPPGQRRLVEIARAYISDPRVLLLDEPTGGLNTHEAQEVFDLVKEFRGEGRAIAIIEHRIRTAAEFSDRMVVLDQGKLVAEGDPETVKNSGSVLSAYLGQPREQEKS
jgi:ABC-type branched-subunit amino acid transport system ATPase component